MAATAIAPRPGFSASTTSSAKGTSVLNGRSLGAASQTPMVHRTFFGVRVDAARRCFFRRWQPAWATGVRTVVVASGWVVSGSGDLAVDRGAADREQLGELGDCVIACLGEPEDLDALAGAHLGALPLSLPLARAIAIPSRVRIRSKVDVELGEGSPGC
jgi:hypothetical protein